MDARACFVLLLIFAAGCADSQASPDDAPQAVLPEPTSAETIETPPRNETPPAPLVNTTTVTHAVTLGLSGGSAVVANQYFSDSAMGDGFSGNCLKVNTNGPIDWIEVNLTWAAQPTSGEALRVVLTAPDVPDGALAEVEGTSPLSHSFDTSLLHGTSEFNLVVTHPSDSAAASAGQEVDLRVTLTWEGFGEPEYRRPACAA